MKGISVNCVKLNRICWKCIYRNRALPQKCVKYPFYNLSKYLDYHLCVGHDLLTQIYYIHVILTKMYTIHICMHSINYVEDD